MKRKYHKPIKVIVRELNGFPEIKRLDIIDDICHILGTEDVIFTRVDKDVYAASRKDAEKNGEKMNCIMKHHFGEYYFFDVIYGTVVLLRFNRKTERLEGLTDGQLRKHMFYKDELDATMDEAV